jgi:hypothetical protein
VGSPSSGGTVIAAGGGGFECGEVLAPTGECGRRDFACAGGESVRSAHSLHFSFPGAVSSGAGDFFIHGAGRGELSDGIHGQGFIKSAHNVINLESHKVPKADVWNNPLASEVFDVSPRASKHGGEFFLVE